MTIEFLSEGEEDEPPLPFSWLWAAINHIEAHQESGTLRLRYERQGKEVVEELYYRDGALDEGLLNE